MASTSVKAAFRHASSRSESLRNTAAPNERSSLLGHIGSDEDSRGGAYVRQIWEPLSASYAHVLLIVVPFALLSGLVHWNAKTVFALNFIAIVPLQSIADYVTEELSGCLGQTLGGLLNAVFGNITNFIVLIPCLEKIGPQIVQQAILGNLFLSLLFLPGLSFFIGGISCRINAFSGSTISALLFPAIASVAIVVSPSLICLAAVGKRTWTADSTTLSIIGAIVLLFLYAASLFFMIRTHVDLFDEDIGNLEEDEYDESSTSPLLLCISLVLVVALLYLCANAMVSGLSTMIDRSDINPLIAGFVLLPHLACSEYITTAVVSYKNRVGLALAVCCGSIIEMALFVTPILILVGTLTHHSLTLAFRGTECVAVALAALLFGLLLLRGTSNYFDGLLCIGFYSIVVTAFSIASTE